MSVHEFADLALVALALLEPLPLRLLETLLLFVEFELAGNEPLGLAFDLGLLGACPAFQVFALTDERLMLQLNLFADTEQFPLLIGEHVLLKAIVLSQLQAQVSDRLCDLG